MKRCFKCLCEKPLEAADGRLNKCIECTKKDVARHRQENWEKVRQYDRMRSSQPHRVVLRREISERWSQQYPNRRAAHHAVQYALKTGAIKRTPCLVCGEPKVEGHHPDYDRPLDVVWLCVPHHRQTHALVANESQQRKAA